MAGKSNVISAAATGSLSERRIKINMRFRTIKDKDDTVIATLTPWQFKLIVQALDRYAPDSPQASEYPEECWTFVKGMKDHLSVIDFMEEIQKPSDTGLLGPCPKLRS